MKYHNKILAIIKGREMTLSQIANQNNLNYQSTKNYLEMLTELDLLQIRLIKNKKYYSEKLKEPKFWFILEQSIRSLSLDEFPYLIEKIKQILIQKELKENKQ